MVRPVEGSSPTPPKQDISRAGLQRSERLNATATDAITSSCEEIDNCLGVLTNKQMNLGTKFNGNPRAVTKGSDKEASTASKRIFGNADIQDQNRQAIGHSRKGR